MSAAYGVAMVRHGSNSTTAISACGTASGERRDNIPCIQRHQLRISDPVVCRRIRRDTAPNFDLQILQIDDPVLGDAGICVET